MNRVILIGRMSRDPEVRYTQGAEPLAVCSFSVAVDKPYSRNRQEGEPTADFINCVAFGRRGENIGQYFRKGNRIAVQGRIQTRSYQDQQDNRRYVTEVVVDEFDFLESRAEREASQAQQSFGANEAPSAPVQMPSAGFSIDSDADDEDLPF